MRVIDKVSFLDTFQYFDRSIVVEIIDIFLKEYPERLEALKKDIEKNDFEALRFDAHSLKGVVSNFVAEQTVSLARQMEFKAGEKDATGLPILHQQLEQSVVDLVDDLKEIRLAFLD